MSGEEEIEVIDLTAMNRNRSAIQKILGDVSKQSVAKQIAIGGGAGWVAGYLFIKVGKIAACSLGTTLLLVQIAQHQGYIHINWSKVNRQVEQTRKRVQKEAAKQYPSLVNELQRFVQQNMFLAGSFAGGFFIGLSF